MTFELKLTNAETYIKSLLFIAANIALPHLFHLIPGGGIMFLPIYFFTMCGTLCYGWRVGLLTALFSPLIGNLLFGAPAAPMLPDMALKGVSLVVAASLLMKKNQRFPILNPLVAVVAAWAVVGVIETPFTGASYAFQDFSTGLPGMALMTLGGMAALKLRNLHTKNIHI